ncbi:hypothetical protein ACWFR5_44765 [Streptomyces sp. NPDC055092]
MSDAARRTLRTALQTLLALVPLLASDGGVAAARQAPALAGAVAVAAAVSRVMALPGVDRLLPPWLRKEAGGTREGRAS